VPTDRRQIVMRSGLFALLVVLALVAVVVLAPADASTSYRPSGRARPVPTEQLAPVTGDEFGGILVGLRGTPVVVNVWASWCPPCRAEMPLLERAADEFDGRVVFLGVASRDSVPAAAEFLDEVGVTYPNVFDATGQVREDLELRGFPTTYVFDADGELREAVVGGVTEPRLAAQLEDLVR
jgi:cytochrome c biogenesis protein CcmG/thiol:disulfide interchange protein DsbE